MFSGIFFIYILPIHRYITNRTIDNHHLIVLHCCSRHFIWILFVFIHCSVARAKLIESFSHSVGFLCVFDWIKFYFCAKILMIKFTV